MAKTTSEPGFVARRFHEDTKHSPESVWGGGHRLDWRNKPHPFKVYKDAEAVDLPRPFRELGVPAMQVLESAPPADAEAEPDLAGLARLLAFGAGVLRRVTYGDGETFHFRTYASAGALYPVEIYVVNEAMEGLDAGVYHFDPLGFRLIRLRDGDHRGVVAKAAAEDERVAAAPVVLVLTGLPWRTAWKYTERGYRHLFWDAGMILANVFALAGSAGWASRLVLGHVDGELNTLLDIDGKREFPLCAALLGSAGSPPAPNPLADAISAQASPLSRREIEFQAIGEVNEASGLRSGEEVLAWRSRLSGQLEGCAPAVEAYQSDGTTGSEEGAPNDSLEDVIRRRGSARFFGQGSMPRAALHRTFGAATGPIRTDYARNGAAIVEPYLIANAVDGLAPGAYVYRHGDFRLLREGKFRAEAGYLCLEQRIGADAAATIFLMADLDFILDAAGDRGYRLAQLEAGLVGGRIYLGAYAHRFGATGLTFYDDLVTEFFSPDASGKSCLLVVAVGESPRLRRQRRTR